jgi:hypothetical protein
MRTVHFWSQQVSTSSSTSVRLSLEAEILLNANMEATFGGRVQVAHTPAFTYEI